MLIIAYPSMFIFLHLRSTWGSPSLRPVQPQPRMRFQLPKSMPGRVHLAGGKRRLSRSVPRSHSGPTTPYGTFRCAHGDTLHVTWSVGVYLYIYIVFTNQCVMYYVYLYIYIYVVFLLCMQVSTQWLPKSTINPHEPRLRSPPTLWAVFSLSRLATVHPGILSRRARMFERVRNR